MVESTEPVGEPEWAEMAFVTHTMFGSAAETYVDHEPKTYVTVSENRVAINNHTVFVPTDHVGEGVIGGSEVWVVDNNCVVGVFYGMRGCVEDKIQDLAANQNVVYVLADNVVYGFTHVEPQNKALAHAFVGTKGVQRPILRRHTVQAAISTVRVALQPLKRKILWIDANSSHVIAGYTKNIAVVAPSLPVDGERAYAHWSPRLCEPETHRGCFFNEYGTSCHLRTKCKRASALESGFDTKCETRRQKEEGWRFDTHHSCDGVAVFRNSRFHSCSKRTSCKKYDRLTNRCLFEGSRKRERRSLELPQCVTHEVVSITNTSTVAPEISCGENQFVGQGVCIECARCGAGMRLVRWCTTDSDTVCGDCPPNTFQPLTVHNKTSCRPRNGCPNGSRTKDGDCSVASIPWEHAIWVAAAAYALLASMA